MHKKSHTQKRFQKALDLQRSRPTAQILKMLSYFGRNSERVNESNRRPDNKQKCLRGSFFFVSCVKPPVSYSHTSANAGRNAKVALAEEVQKLPDDLVGLHALRKMA